MTTTWSPNFPILGEGCNELAQWVKKMSGGRLEITVYGGDELIPALEGLRCGKQWGGRNESRIRLLLGG